MSCGKISLISQLIYTVLFQVIKARDNLPDNKPPVLVKIAADLTQEAKEDIADVITTPPVSAICLGMREIYERVHQGALYFNFFIFFV